MRLLCISLEFTAGTFSGNGIYCISQVRALSRLGHQVLVLCGKPEGHAEAQRLEGAAGLLEVELPVWGRLDAECGWRAFAAGAGAPAVVQAVAAFAPEAVLGVDWHSLAAYEALEGALIVTGQRLAPYVFMNYRVYLRTAEGEDAALLSRLERAALHRSALTTALSSSDAQFLSEAFPEEAAERPLHVLLPALRADIAQLPIPPDVTAALPCCCEGRATCQQGGCCAGQGGCGGPLPTCDPERQSSAACQNPSEKPSERGCGMPAASSQGPAAADPAAAAAAVPAAAQPASAAARAALDPGRGRYLLTCAVRISPEKEPHRFVDLAAELARRAALEAAGVVPLMLGAGWGSEYGAALRERLAREVPQCVVLDTFLGPTDLAAIYSATLLNVHPCLYDAYGMTVVEAASQGAPSLVNAGGHVGATDLLDAAQGEALCLDLSRPTAELADEVEGLLRDRGALRCVGAAAARKARSWSEEANAARLVELVRGALGGGASS